MRWIVVVVAVLAWASSAAAQVVPEDEWDDEAKLWLARSVIGEAGWRRPDEHTAIAYVYATRASQTTRYTFTEMVRRYSAAIRAPGKRSRPWLLELSFDCARPKSWPVDPVTKQGPLWGGLHSEAWRETLQWADEWQAGHHENPCPGANHFGGYQDVHRAQMAGWKRLRCKTRMYNRFYNSKRKAR